MKALFLLPFLIGLTAGIGSALPPLDLSDYQWKNRLLLVFTPSADNRVYQELRHELRKEQAELEERDLVVVHLIGENSGSVQEQGVDPESVRSLRKLYGVNPEALTFVLIGKDGGEKARQVDGFDLQALFVRIDAMPMRQREMRERKEK